MQASGFRTAEATLFSPRPEVVAFGRTSELSCGESVRRSVREISIIRHYVLCSVYLHASLGLGYSSRSDQGRVKGGGGGQGD